MKMIKKTILGASLALLSMNLMAATSLKIGTEGGYPPWSMVDATGNVTGFDADMGAAICKEINADCTFVVQAFDSLIPSLNAKRFDLIISGMSYTPERAKRVNFSIPYAVEDAIFILPAKSDLIKAADLDTIVKGLAGKTIGVQGGTTHGAYITEIAPKATIRNYDTLDQMQIDLDAGRLDGTFADLVSQTRFLHSLKGNDYALTEHVVKGSSAPEVLGYGIAVGINQDNTELKAQVDAALCKLIKDGTVKSSSEKWFDVDLSNYEACAE